jgi:hypothetical protein
VAEPDWSAADITGGAHAKIMIASRVAATIVLLHFLSTLDHLLSIIETLQYMLSKRGTLAEDDNHRRHGTDATETLKWSETANVST